MRRPGEQQGRLIFYCSISTVDRAPGMAGTKSASTHARHRLNTIDAIVLGDGFQVAKVDLGTGGP